MKRTTTAPRAAAKTPPETRRPAPPGDSIGVVGPVPLLVLFPPVGTGARVVLVFVLVWMVTEEEVETIGAGVLEDSVVDDSSAAVDEGAGVGVGVGVGTGDEVGSEPGTVISTPAFAQRPTAT